MTINLHLPTRTELLRPTIAVIGVGGAGGNAVNNMIAASLEGVNFVVANTDAQALDHSLTDRTIQLGAGITKGLGAGANPEVGRAAAEEAHDEIAAYIEGSNMVFITAGMGGGTGTGAAPVVARIAKEQGILTVGVVTKPFQFEGAHRMKMAEAGLRELQDYVDTLIIIPNQNLFRIANERTTFADAFKMADEVLHSGVRGVTDLMIKPGLINLDFADIRTVMREMGKAMMGTGEASGERRAIEAAEAAISNPLLDEVSLKGARAALINITGGMDITLFEVDEAANRIREEVDPDANIIVGTALNEEIEGRMRVSVVATGIDAQAQATAKPAASAAETKKPFTYVPVAKEPIKTPPVRAAYDPRPLPEQRPAAASVDRPETAAPAETVMAAPRRMPEPESEVAYRVSVESRPAPRDPAPVQQEMVMEARQEARIAMGAAAPRHEYREMHEGTMSRGFFKRMADVGRALSARHDDIDGSRPQAHERVHVVQKTAADPAEKGKGGEDQYDIPAFLRRQAN
ncbi:MAG: cell division protein FtsZ [Pseudomonadota bacterium]|nr:cell division protein FtsZ [Pseudomonadota bacterium]MDE3038504.1 cell division protein FtsZ [Pseudomonadota bacterium]